MTAPNDEVRRLARRLRNDPAYALLVTEEMERMANTVAALLENSSLHPSLVAAYGRYTTEQGRLWGDMPESDTKNLARRAIRRRRYMVAFLKKAWHMKDALDET